MEDTIEEVEIKIEYNESFETDPLCDKNLNHVQSNQESITDCFPGKTTQLPTSKVNVAEHEETSFEASTDETFHSSDNTNIKNITDIEVTWFKSVDSLGRLLCKFCNLKYSTLETIRYHVKRKHPEHVKHIKENLVKYKRSSQLKCHVCKERFKEKLALKSHIDSYHLLTNLKTSCLYCDATFYTENEISQHLYEQHKKVVTKSTYMCNLCGYRTSIRSHYNQHKNTHEGAKTKKCRYCEYATNYTPNLKIHERIHTKEKVYACDFIDCDYRCTAKSALRSHRLKHNPEQNTLYCDKCSYKTIYKQTLNRHFDWHRRNSVKLKL